jgi:hypothetical protein
MTARMPPVEDLPTITVQRAGSPADVDAVRGLVREFNRWVILQS